MGTPKRIERKRRRGWRMPSNAVYVGRPTIWGNPFRVTRSSDFHGLPGSWFLLDDDGGQYHPDEDTQRSARQKAVDLYAWHLDQRAGRVTEDMIRTELAGRDLVCWCPGKEPCHADVLLGIANGAALELVGPGTAGADLVVGTSAHESARPPTHTFCPRCGTAASGRADVVDQFEGDLSVIGFSSRVRCSGCGFEHDATGPSAP